MKFSTKKKPINISRGMPGIWMEAREEMGYVSVNGLWAIHRAVLDPQKFTLTHLPSGYNIGRYFKRKSDCEKAARILNPLADWKKDVRKNKEGFWNVKKKVRLLATKRLTKTFGKKPTE